MTSSSTKNKPLIAVVGETASGKSSLALAIARRHAGQLICADSRTIYKGMNIGTAKPSASDQSEIRHFGLDLVEPGQSFSAALFKQYATSVMDNIWSTGGVPILVGGTGLYVNGILYDYSFGDKFDSDLRSKLNNKSVEELATIAKQKGIEPSEQIKKNKRHLIRLIERNGTTGYNTQLRNNSLIIGISLTKTQLRKRVEERVEQMFRAGLRKEYNDLRKNYALGSEAFTGIGYQEFAKWELGESSMSEVKREIVKNTMNLAKRQRTWFKRDKNILWVTTQKQALALTESFLQNKTHET